MPVIRISDALYERLKNHAEPFTDTPAKVITRLLDIVEATDAGRAEMCPVEARQHRRKRPVKREGSKQTETD